MIIDLTPEELVLVKESVSQVDWSYAGHGKLAESVARKCREAAQKWCNAETKREQQKLTGGQR